MVAPAAAPTAPTLAALLDAARTAEAQQGPQAALALLTAAPATLHHLGTYAYARGALLVRCGQFDDAIAWLEQAVEREPLVAEMASNLGAALLARLQARGPAALRGADSQADLARALAVLAQAVDLTPSLATVHSNYGRALTLANRGEAALAQFDLALALDADDVHALYNKASALHALQRLDEARALLKQITTRHPGFAPAQLSLAKLG